jgi:hypothetical protein
MYEDEFYVFLQIHGGCDIRGGYTDPVIFQVHYEDLICGCDVERGYSFGWECPECGERWVELDYGEVYLEKKYDQLENKLKSFSEEQRTLEGNKVIKQDVDKEARKKLECGEDIEIINSQPYHKGCKTPLIWDY